LERTEQHCLGTESGGQRCEPGHIAKGSGKHRLATTAMRHWTRHTTRVGEARLTPGGTASISSPAQFDAAAPTWDARHGPASPRASEFSHRIRYLRALCREMRRPRVLDLGCGTGQTLFHLADLINGGVGVDSSRAMISQARRNAGIRPLRFVVDDVADFCADCPARFDLVLLIGVVEHLSDRAAVFTGIDRVLASQGRLIIISPHPWNPTCWLKRLLDSNGNAPPPQHLSPFQLRKLAARHALELSAMRALPYAPWPKLAGARRACGSAVRGREPRMLSGMLRGAFAAEFCRRR
jgi:SAM-dependent methyltransferase